MVFEVQFHDKKLTESNGYETILCSIVTCDDKFEVYEKISRIVDLSEFQIIHIRRVKDECGLLSTGETVH